MNKKKCLQCVAFHNGKEIDLKNFKLTFDVKVRISFDSNSNVEDACQTLLLTVPSNYFEIIKNEDVYISIDQEILPHILKVQLAGEEDELFLYLDSRCKSDGTLWYRHEKG